MKIVIAGAHGVGKTTIANILAKEFSLPIIPDVAIEAFSKGFPINENTPAETQFWMFARQLELERNLGDKWIADKCLMDYSIYADVLFKDERVKQLLSEMVKRNVNYNFVFYLPIEFPIEDNGIRSIDPVFQKNVDSRYLQVLNDWGINYHTISGSIEERLKKIMNIINKK